MKSVYAAVTATALATLMGQALAQSPAAGTTADQKAPQAEPAADEKAGAEASSPEDVKAPAPERTEAVRRQSERIAQNAPKRNWRKVPSSPARDHTVMFEVVPKKASDVPIIASVDQQNKLELLDITGEGTSDTLRFPSPGLGGSKTAMTGEATSAEGQAGAEENGSSEAESSALQSSPEKAPTLDSLSEDSPQQ